MRVVKKEGWQGRERKRKKRWSPKAPKNTEEHCVETASVMCDDRQVISHHGPQFLSLFGVLTDLWTPLVFDFSY